MGAQLLAAVAALTQAVADLQTRTNGVVSAADAQTAITGIEAATSAIASILPNP